ncbi:unnamed protein product [Adineta ricciae]|uniref:Uncharacterized protein n=1 Tax=Adineta ricciae TaxID=249248 RepID=A0A815WBE0_ADIRI|nr:unnamed protein product [Adineta ricciae]CAF1541331.1 unnamed protein product [Adineta ricciae]
MNTANPDSDQRPMNAAVALGVGVAANVVLNTKLLEPLVTKLDQWIAEGIQQFQRWSQDQSDLAAQRHKHESLEDRIWNALVANKFKVAAGGIAIAGITVKWSQIIEFIRKYAPDSCSECLRKVINLRSQIETIINSPAFLTANVAVSLTIAAYGLYIAYGASQQLKELGKVTFEPVKRNFDEAISNLIAAIQSSNISAARIRAAFTRLELANITAQDKLQSTIRQVIYHHNKALKRKDRVDLAGHVALGASICLGVGALYSGAQAVKEAGTALAIAKATLVNQSAALSFLFLTSYGTCKFGSRRCQLVIDKCEELQTEAKETMQHITQAHTNAKEELEVLLERTQIHN